MLPTKAEMAHRRIASTNVPSGTDEAFRRGAIAGICYQKTSVHCFVFSPRASPVGSYSGSSESRHRRRGDALPCEYRGKTASSRSREHAADGWCGRRRGGEGGKRQGKDISAVRSREERVQDERKNRDEVGGDNNMNGDPQSSESRPRCSLG